MANKPIRHGELIFKLVKTIPKGTVTTVDSYIGADSDAGHDHILKSKGMVLTKTSDATYVEIRETGTIVHRKESDRHRDLVAPVGKYKLNLKTEYDMFDKAIRRVQD